MYGAQCGDDLWVDGKLDAAHSGGMQNVTKLVDLLYLDFRISTDMGAPVGLAHHKSTGRKNVYGTAYAVP